MKNYLQAFILLAALFCCGTVKAQTTGSFDTTITFMGGARNLSLYVPTTYTPATKYRLMICLHGLGDTSTNYRNALINSLGWNTAIPNTIFVCPEAATIYSDYYSAAGSEAIIQQSINVAMSKYHIDTANVILQGFSLGGRAALRYGLDNYATFKGLLLNTPAIQGVKNAVNGQSTYQFNYANASRIPIYITHGATDILYTSPIDSTYEQLILNDGKVRYYDFPGLGHTIPPTAQIINFLSFFNGPANPGKDVDVIKIDAPDRICNTQLPASLLIRNVGADTITDVTFSYGLNGSNQVYMWTGKIASYQHAMVALPGLTGTSGTNTLHVQVKYVNGTFADTVLANNAQNDTTEIVGQSATLPLTERFEGNTFPPAGWMLEQAGDLYSPWDIDNTVASTGTSSVGAFNTILIFDNAGRKEGLLSPVLNLATISNPRVSFDVAYNYHRFTPPYFTANVDFADTLEVLISTDCGGNYTRLYKKGGAELATFNDPILNPINLNSCFIVPLDSNWKRVSIDLSSYASSSKAIVKFNYISALGGSINIDNISFSNSATGIAGVDNSGFKIYPNPATDKVNISTSGTHIDKVEVLDITGRHLFTVEGSKSQGTDLIVDTQSLHSGIYIVQIYAGKEVKTEKITIEK